MARRFVDHTELWPVFGLTFVPDTYPNGRPSAQEDRDAMIEIPQTIIDAHSAAVEGMRQVQRAISELETPGNDDHVKAIDEMWRQLATDAV